MVLLAEPAQGASGPLTPSLYRVVARRRETADVATVSLECLNGTAPVFSPGQFNMLTAFGVGEVAISISSAPGETGPLEHTIRDVGAVTHALTTSPVGSTVGIRGPFGTDWGVDALSAADVVVVAGGIGLAPLRGAIRWLVGDPERTGRVTVLAGARSPDQIPYENELDAWRRGGAYVAVTVDVAGPGWPGPVGVVTGLIPDAPFVPERTIALICGPEIMMRFTIRSLMDRGLAPERIRIALERNMQCGIGWCGHCQLGPLLICRDGPVFTYSESLAELLSERER
jgi:anaerobic sulfite reductase subunit B